MCALMQARPDRILRTAILLHDVGKPLCRSTDEKGIDHFYGHPEAGAKIAETSPIRSSGAWPMRSV